MRNELKASQLKRDRVREKYYDYSNLH